MLRGLLYASLSLRVLFEKDSILTYSSVACLKDQITCLNGHKRS